MTVAWLAGRLAATTVFPSADCSVGWRVGHLADRWGQKRVVYWAGSSAGQLARTMAAQKAAASAALLAPKLAALTAALTVA